MLIDCDFDGGSIIVLGDPAAPVVSLSLRPDSAADFRQWFCFRSYARAGARRRFRIEDAGQAEYPGAWENYRVCASYDGESWFRVATRYQGGGLDFVHTPSRRGVTYAMFAPFSLARQRRLLGRARRSGKADVFALGETVEGRPVSAIRMGREGAPRVWVIARQHPGEAMATWCAAGLVDRLLDADDVVSGALLDEAQIVVVPCVNVDGAVLGNHRTNAAGRDLNRSWDAPDLSASPEVFAVRAAMLESGVDLFLDVHGDEDFTFSFAAGCEGNPGYSERIAALEGRFSEIMEAVEPSFQPGRGYDPDPPGEGDPSCAANWVGHRFDCLSLTLELPFKDDERRPDPRKGWSPERSRDAGRAIVECVLAILPHLR